VCRSTTSWIWSSTAVPTGEWGSMDLSSVAEVRSARELDRWRSGDAWLAGGTFLFSQQQPGVTRLLDLGTMGWPPLRTTATGLEIAATCTVSELARLTPQSSQNLVVWCCQSFASSFKVWNTATIGGNLCLALSAAPMISLTTALDGTCTLVGADGRRRSVAVPDFIVGAGRTVLEAGELLRSVTLSAAALRDPVAYRRCSLRQHGRPAVMIIGRLRSSDGAFILALSAATSRPVVLSFDNAPGEADLRHALTGRIPPDSWVDDVHGALAWRQHMTLRLAEQVRRELLGGT
jgi:CO/xanthine dehydrogenase FAD-binding subunit